MWDHMIDLHLVEGNNRATVEAKPVVTVVDSSADATTISAGLVFARGVDFCRDLFDICAKVVSKLVDQIEVEKVHRIGSIKVISLSWI